MLRPLRHFPVAIALIVLWTSHAAAMEPDTFSPIVSFQRQESLSDPGTPTAITSPVVSFQFQESLADPGTTITSPVVSFQFYEWPGDENLTFENSPAVSYHFYNGPSLLLTGTVKSAAGVPVSGAIVTMRRYGTVFWQATTNGSGTYTTSGLPADNFTVTVTKTGYVTSLSNIPGTSGGNRSLDFTIIPLPAPLPVVTVNRTPLAQCFLPDPPTNPLDPATPRLKVFNGVQFVDSQISLNPLLPTVILTHGWRSSSDFNEWPRSMASRIWSRLGGTAVNIVAWDWKAQAAATVSRPLPSSEIACEQGELLGKALRQSSLGGSYHQHVHFIGHSMGTIVNATACDYLHGDLPRTQINPLNPWDSQETTPHITILDGAGIVPKVGLNIVPSSSFLWEIASKGIVRSVVNNTAIRWKSPIPKKYSWIDNYISMVGRPHKEAVNVVLSKFHLNPIAAHAYAYSWYEDTVIPGGASAPIGFDSSFESGNDFPPMGLGHLPDSLWFENLATADPLDLNYAPSSSPLDTANNFILKPAEKTGNAILAGYGMGIQFAGNIGGTVIYKTGQVVASTSQKVGFIWDAASDKAADILNNLNPDVTTTDPLAAAVFRLRLQTLATPPSNIQSFGKLTRSNLNSSSVGQPAYAWVSVQVPPDAGMMAFDFTVTGDPVDDKIVCAINEQNVFSLAAKFAPDGEPVSTDLIDVSAYAGQTVELFFGLAGGTSTDCELAIDGVRFITIPQPKLVASVVGGQIRLSWPAAATGWVLESSDSMELGSWREVPTSSGVSVDQGVATMEQPRAGLKMFYRLRRNE